MNVTQVPCTEPGYIAVISQHDQTRKRDQRLSRRADAIETIHIDRCTSQVRVYSVDFFCPCAAFLEIPSASLSQSVNNTKLQWRPELNAPIFSIEVPLIGSKPRICTEYGLLVCFIVSELQGGPVIKSAA